MASSGEVARIMGVMAHAYPRYELTADSVKVYGVMLSDIPVEILEAAARQIMAELKFFPSIAEWREMAHKLMIGELQIPSAYEAWENAMAQVRRCGEYYRYQVNQRTPEYSHPLVEKAVNVIGYRHLCESENIGIERAHFFKIYESLLSRAEQETRMLPEVKEASRRYIEGVEKLSQRLEAKNDSHF